MASSYKFCVIAIGEYVYICCKRKKLMNGIMRLVMLIAENAGAIIKFLDGKPFLYGKEDYKNSSLLIKRSQSL